MKKIVTAALSLSICIAKAYSQTQWGIKAGLNLAQIQNAEYFEPSKSRLGLNGGLLARFISMISFLFNLKHSIQARDLNLPGGD
jgi:hypothetical protein